MPTQKMEVNTYIKVIIMGLRQKGLVYLTNMKEA